MILQVEDNKASPGDRKKNNNTVARREVQKDHSKKIKFSPKTIYSGWWLNQPVWKICSSNGIIAQVGVEINNIWNHHLVFFGSKEFLSIQKWGLLF